MSDTDSDEDLMPNSVRKYQRETAGFNRRNFNNTNIRSYSFRNNMMASTLNMPHMHRQGNNMRGFDQRSVYYRIGTCPTSLRSFRDSGAQKLHNSIYNRADDEMMMMSSQRSAFNGRSGSSMSMRNSNVSISAADIALAFKNVKFNKYDLRLIKKAYNKFMKNHVRKRIEKRRNLKPFTKGYRQRLSEDSGEQGSESSISSDDCRSSRTIPHKDNIPTSINIPLTRYDLTQFRASMKRNDLYKDCTKNLKQNYLRKMFTVSSLKHTTNYSPQEKDENTSVVTQKKRFASFQCPCQRFNQSKVISNETSATNVLTEIPRNKNNPHTQTESTKAFDTDSEKEEIFSQSTVKANSTHELTMQQKRVLEDEESNSCNRKRSKTALSPIKENDSLSNNINIQNNDFNFRKPKTSVRKISDVKKDSVPEILIAKSRLPLTENLELDLPNNNNKSMCNSDEGNNTYTDEEIFKVPQTCNGNNTKEVNKKVDKPQPTVNNTIELNNDSKVVKQMETNACSSKNDAPKSECPNSRTVSNCVKFFWDLDSESDMEEQTVTPWTSKYQVKQDNGVHKDDSKSSSNTNLSKRNFIKGTILTVRSFQRNGLKSSTRSDNNKIRQQKNNKTPNKNTKSSQNDEEKH